MNLRPQDVLYRVSAEPIGRREPGQAFEDRGGCPLQVKQYTKVLYIKIRKVFGMPFVLSLLGVLGVQNVFGVQSVLGVFGVFGVLGVLGVLGVFGVQQNAM